MTRLKKIFVLAAVVLLSPAMNAQQSFSRDSADFYLRKLDNNAVTRQHMPSRGLPEDPAVQALYHHADNYILNVLTDLLADSSKVVAAHFLLTRLLEPEGQVVYRTTEDLTDSILVINRYNGLSWKKIYDKINLTDTIRVDDIEIKQVQAYWLRKRKPVPAN